MAQKNYLVVGGSSGIGLSIVNKLVDEGHLVTVISRNTDQLGLHQHLTHLKADVISDDFEKLTLPEILDGLVYCPGSIVLKPFKSLSEEQFTADFTINCLGAVRSIKATFNSLKKSVNSPSVVLFSTVAVSQGMPFHSSVASAKGAVEGLTRSLAAEFAPGIRVNCIAPSLTDTPLAAKILSSPEKISAVEQRHPLKTIGSPGDLAAISCFLLSSEAKWISGQVIHVDGGLSALRV
jgi:NAD(P)-dependent dehydrogenase (short-subunit alcohol dehydrogenase family)